MLNLAFTLIPSAAPQARTSLHLEADEGFLARLVLWVRTQIRYERALHELHRLDDRDLNDLDLARADFPALAWRHATGAEPLRRPLA
jgi:uncharacterized protein YjiS (DUF1127 family)